VASSPPADRDYCWLVPLLAMTLVSMGLAVWAGFALGIPAVSAALNYAAEICLMGPVTIVALLGGAFVRCALRRDPSPVATIRRAIADRFATPADAAATIVPIALVPLLMGAYGTLKQAFPLLHPFTWDDTFATADRLLFFGRQPWELTHAIAGSAATVLIDRFYSAWVILLPCAVLAYAVVAPREVRARFFLSFAAGWLLIGLVGGVALSSAGPCYAQALGIASSRDYAPLMHQLAAVDRTQPLNAILWQHVLWKAHVAHVYAFGMGISAMPSMHNAISFLYFLSVPRSSPLLRKLAGAFAALMLFGSIHLGWHYAVDGFVAWAGMAAIWWGSGLYLRKVGYLGRGDAQTATPVHVGGTVAA
jgi:hypothetical protein